MDRKLQEYIEFLGKSETAKEYQTAVDALIQYFMCGGRPQTAKQIRIKSEYMTNRFSMDATEESRKKAKNNLLLYLREVFMQEGLQNRIAVEQYLNNFQLFMECLTDRTPDKRATLTKERLEKIKVYNEYDLQHLLYAAIKPLYPEARTEVTEDTGYGAVRSDIWIPTDRIVIEAKCTRKNMTAKRLVEEIEADIVHYQADSIFFYIYDGEKIIGNKQAFEGTYHRKFDGKYVHAVCFQPISF